MLTTLNVATCSYAQVLTSATTFTDLQNTQNEN
jgi:hypothetical protein